MCGHGPSRKRSRQPVIGLFLFGFDVPAISKVIVGRVNPIVADIAQSCRIQFVSHSYLETYIIMILLIYFAIVYSLLHPHPQFIYLFIRFLAL